MTKIKSTLFISIFICLSACSDNKIKYSNSIISSPNPLATQAGKIIYSKGGNAFDAAVAASFALSVVEPSMSGIGGRLQVIYKQANGDILGIDGTTQIPQNFINQENNLPSYGYKTIGIPGVVAGLIKLHEENGLLNLKSVMEPAIKLAEEGFIILPGEIKRQQSEKDKLNEFDGSKKYFLDSKGDSFEIGDRLIQEDLAYTLKVISEKGKKGFYDGEIAKKIAEDIQLNGGFISLNDLKNYSAKKSTVLLGDFNGYRIHALDLPSYGSITIQMLQIFDYLDIKNEGDWII